MKIGKKLTLGFTVIAVLFWIVGYASFFAGREVLKRVIGKGALIYASEVLREIDMMIYFRREEMQCFARTSKLREAAENSNAEFEKLSDIQDYIGRREHEWVSSAAEKPTYFMQRVLNNELSKKLRRKIEFHDETYDFRVFGEMFVTNKYGANIGQSGKTTDYYQADEKWWQEAEKNGLYVGDVGYDRSAGINSIDICVRIDDKNGNFVGVLKGVLDLEDVVGHVRLVKAASPYRSLSLWLVDKKGSILASIYTGSKRRGAHEKHASPPPQALAQAMQGKSGFFIDTEERERVLTVFSHSKGFGRYKGVGWSLIINLSTSEIFRPVILLRNISLCLSGAIALAAVFVGFFISRSISLPITKLRDTAADIDRGNMDAEIEAIPGDEVGELASSFKSMVTNLKCKQAELTFAKEQLLESAYTLEKKVVEKTVDLTQAQGATLNIMEDLEESKRYTENILANFLDTLIVVNMDGMIQSVNQVALDLTGYKDTELIGKPFGTIFANRGEAAVIIDGFKQPTGNEKPSKLLNYETNYKRKDGPLVPVLLSGTTMLDKDGQSMGIVIVAKDITSRKKAEEALRLGQLGKLVADMAHEVNNPLMIISGRAQISIMGGMKGEELKENARIIMDQCQRARDIIQRLLLFSKPSKGEIKEINIREVIDFVIGLIEHQFSLDNINIVKKYARTLPSLKIDGKQIHEVFINLFKNSAEAMLEGGTITVAVAAEGNRVRIEIADIGSGISEDNIGRIFDPFFTTKESGTGLGLSVCYGIIKVYGGDMKCVSRPGEGTIMTILLPITQQ